MCHHKSNKNLGRRNKNDEQVVFKGFLKGKKILLALEVQLAFMGNAV
jgi:hypothetical protein